MDFKTALRELGVRDDTLTQEEKARLDEDGFLPLEGVLSIEQIERMRDCVENLGKNEGGRAGLEAHQEAGTNRLADLVNKDPIFEICYTHPRVLGAIAHVIAAEFKLSSLNSRAALPGEGLQQLHADFDRPVPPGGYVVCNSIWLLDDFTEENGATRLVPGSHKRGKLPHQEMDDPTDTHPEEIKLIAPAGTVAIFNSHTWHGGTRNVTDRPRRAVHSYFCRRDQPQQTDQRRYIRPDTTVRLPEAALYILDVL